MGRKYTAFGVSDASRALVSHTADVGVGAASLRREAVKPRGWSAAVGAAPRRLPGASIRSQAEIVADRRARS
jgi:hypothetical protein